jgi:hypothetical protein
MTGLVVPGLLIRLALTRSGAWPAPCPPAAAPAPAPFGPPALPGLTGAPAPLSAGWAAPSLLGGCQRRPERAGCPSGSGENTASDSASAWREGPPPLTGTRAGAESCPAEANTTNPPGLGASTGTGALSSLTNWSGELATDSGRSGSAARPTSGSRVSASGLTRLLAASMFSSRSRSSRAGRERCWAEGANHEASLRRRGSIWPSQAQRSQRASGCSSRRRANMAILPGCAEELEQAAVVCLGGEKRWRRCLSAVSLRIQGVACQGKKLGSLEIHGRDTHCRSRVSPARGILGFLVQPAHGRALLHRDTTTGGPGRDGARQRLPIEVSGSCPWLAKGGSANGRRPWKREHQRR